MAFKIFNSFRNLAKEFYSGKTFVAFDTETTGLKAEKEFIIEIGAVKFNCDGIIGEPFDILIKPPIELPQFIKDLTHITDKMICQAFFKIFSEKFACLKMACLR